MVRIKSICMSQCTYRCVVLPDPNLVRQSSADNWSQCTYRCVVLPDFTPLVSSMYRAWSQCTYRCVVLPDTAGMVCLIAMLLVSMHLQVRGAP